jgi:hypothetical protein
VHFNAGPRQGQGCGWIREPSQVRKRRVS